MQIIHMEYHIESYHQTPSNVSVFPDYRMSPLSPGCQDQPTLSLILFTIIKFLLSEGVLDDELKGKKTRKYISDSFDNPFVCK